jgi:DnaJ-class molecular chaperone
LWPKVVVRKTGITIPGEVLRIEEEGMPHHNFPSDFGSLFIKFTVAFPPSLSDQQKSLVRQMLPA